MEWVTALVDSVNVYKAEVAIIVLYFVIKPAIIAMEKEVLTVHLVQKALLLVKMALV